MQMQEIFMRFYYILFQNQFLDYVLKHSLDNTQVDF